MYAISFITCGVTGFMLYGDTLHWLAPLFGGLVGAGIAHRVAAVFLVASIVISLLMRPKEMFSWIKESITFTKADWGFLKTFPHKFLGIKKEIPPQGFYNGGEKINSLIQIISGAVLIVTGFIMWFSGFFGEGLLFISYPLHSIFFALAAAGAIGHIYLSLLNPVSNEAINAMTTGKISEKYMIENHGQWYEDVYKAQKTQDK
jgi:formate dehydrogenase subunit gamma